MTFRLGGVTVLENDVVSLELYGRRGTVRAAYTVPNGPSFGMFITPNGESIAFIGTDPQAIRCLTLLGGVTQVEQRR